MGLRERGICGRRGFRLVCRLSGWLVFGEWVYALSYVLCLSGRFNFRTFSYQPYRQPYYYEKPSADYNYLYETSTSNPPIYYFSNRNCFPSMLMFILITFIGIYMLVY